MKRIVLHWTSGAYYPNEHEKECYHFLIDKDGVTHEGVYKPEDNENCSDGRYAAHTGGGNTGCYDEDTEVLTNNGWKYFKDVNIHKDLFFTMDKEQNPEYQKAGFTSADNCGNYPITPVQLEACFKLCATLIKKYNLQLSNVITHYEFGKLHPDTSSAGKIDITYLPSYPDVKAEEIGGFIRSKIRWYLERI